MKLPVFVFIYDGLDLSYSFFWQSTNCVFVRVLLRSLELQNHGHPQISQFRVELCSPIKFKGKHKSMFSGLEVTYDSKLGVYTY